VGSNPTLSSQQVLLVFCLIFGTTLALRCLRAFALNAGREREPAVSSFRWNAATVSPLHCKGVTDLLTFAFFFVRGGQRRAQGGEGVETGRAVDWVDQAARQG
jgi:hypothetical protein